MFIFGENDIYKIDGKRVLLEEKLVFEADEESINQHGRLLVVKHDEKYDLYLPLNGKLCCIFNNIVKYFCKTNKMFLKNSLIISKAPYFLLWRYIQFFKRQLAISVNEKISNGFKDNIEILIDGERATDVTLDVTNWDVSNVTDSYNMFYNCTKLVGGAGTVYNSSYTDKTYARIDGGTSNPGYLTLNMPENVVLLSGVELNGLFKQQNAGVQQIIFDYKQNYSSVISGIAGISVTADGSNWAQMYVVGNIIYILSETEMIANEYCNDLFYQLTSLKSVTFNNFNTYNTLDMSFMFYQCFSLEDGDIINYLDTSNVLTMAYIFGYNAL